MPSAADTDHLAAAADEMEKGGSIAAPIRNRSRHLLPRHAHHVIDRAA